MKRFFFVLAVISSFAFTIAAQSNTGNLTITVSDASGVIPGATVLVKDEQTGRERTVTTSDEGTVSLPQLEVGTYTVTVTSAGRKKSVTTGVKVDVAQTFSLGVALEAGDIAEVVEVTAGADVINSSNAEISNTVDTRQIQELPLNGRNPLALIALQAGTSANGATNTVINGQRSSFTNITRDGLNIQDNFIRANATDFVPDRPNTDDVGEFTITTQNAGVEAGYGASQVQLVTPRGSNEFHGAAFIYNRNSKFTGNDFFNNLNNIKRPFLNRNQFGGRFSGPIWKNKLFFFGAYEGFRLRQSANVTRTTLRPDARTGIFTYVDSTGLTRTINLFTAAQTIGTGGGGPVTAIDSTIASRVLANLPAGNNATVGDGRNTIGYSFTQKQNQDREAVQTRFDFDMNDKNTFSGMYSWRDEFLLRPDVDNGGFSDIPFGFQVAKTYTTNVAWRFTPGSNLTNELRLATQLSRPNFDRNNQPTNFFLALPTVSSPESTFQTQGRDTAIWGLNDNAVYTWGDHSIRFGGQIGWYRIAPYGPPAFANSTIPTVTIGTSTATPSLGAGAFPGGFRASDAATQLATANGLLALLGGLVPTVNQSFNATSQDSGYVANALPARRLHFENYSWYVGDSWRVNPNLTLNFGVRQEIYTPVSEPDGLALEPVIGSQSGILAAILNPAGTYDFVGTNNDDFRMFQPDTNNIAPNVSFAWSPNFGGFLSSVFPGEGRTVIRGGYSISYVNDEFVRAADNALAGNAGLTQGVSVTGLNGRLSSFTPSVPTPTFAVPRTYAQNNALAGNFGTVFAIDPELEIPALHQWNIGIQRELPWKTAMEVRYVGNRSNNLVRGFDFNQINLNLNNSGYLADFLRARANMIATGGATGNPNCAPAPGCVPLTFLTTLPNAGLLNNATIRSQIFNGQPADLAFTYITNPGTFPGVSQFWLPNPNTGVVDLLTNGAESNYHSLQTEVRRRFSNGLYFQANYTFAKALTDAAGVGQTRFDPLIDNANQENEYGVADFNTQHVFNFNGIYELPVGKGRKFLNRGGIVDAFLGGWQMTSIIRLSSGAPITFTDPRGTLNRGGRSGRQTASSTLSASEISDLIGIFRTPCGIFWINPAATNVNQSNLNAGNCTNPTTGASLVTGNGIGANFQLNAPGQTGNLPRNAWNGPLFFNWDASLMKNFRITEKVRFQIRGEAFNVLNRANFFVGVFPGSGNISSTSFGRVTSTFGPRVLQFVGRVEF